MINVLLIEDDKLVRHCMRLMLENTTGMHIVGEATTAAEGLALAREKTPDVILLDFRLPDATGLEVARKLLKRLPDSKILVVTGLANNTIPVKLLEVGVHGYINKSNTAEQLLQAIRVVHSGQRYLSPEVANELALGKTAAHPNRTPFTTLSSREMEVLLLLAKGLAINDIAKQLFLSPKTVSSYRYRMHEKLGVKNDIGLIKLAIEHNVIDIDNT